MKAFLICSVLFFSCINNTSQHAGQSGNIDNLKILYFNITDTVLYSENKMSILTAIDEVLNSEPEISSCKPTGLIKFFSGNIEKEQIFFSQNDECLFLIDNGKYYRMNYRIGMFLGEFAQDWKKNHEANN
jgi:hypothetical protein